MPQTSKVSLPREYSFNLEVGVDVLEVKDSEGNPYLLLNIICLGSSFQQCVPIRPGVGQPTSSECQLEHGLAPLGFGFPYLRLCLQFGSLR